MKKSTKKVDYKGLAKEKIYSVIQRALEAEGYSVSDFLDYEGQRGMGIVVEDVEVEAKDQNFKSDVKIAFAAPSAKVGDKYLREVEEVEEVTEMVEVTPTDAVEG